ncbi:MAG: hypothetical protein KGQ50_06725, partial [Bacteroidetes bacterium]|nr:hypothetical protein [Bacteroidota bacterium]
MLNTTETDISQEPNNFSSQVSINNKIQQLPFNFPVELQKHFPHGVLDAQIGLEKSVFQEQSEGGTEYESVDGKVNELEKKQSTAAVLKNDLMDLFGRRELKSLWDKQIAENTAKRDELKDIVASLKLKIKDIILENSLLALVLMLVAAFAFISADFIISLTVVSTQLLLDGQIFEDWKILGFNPSTFIFALALAAIPFLLKPAYDRLIEQPYKLNKNKNYFNVLIILVALTALGLLVNTGFVRLKDFEDFEKIEQANTSVFGGGLRLEILPEPPVPSGTSSPEKPEFFIAFVVVVSGVLFALGGAILLGMGLPELRKRVKRAWLKIVLKINHRRIRLADKKIEKLQELHAFYDRDEAKHCQGMSLDEKWKMLMEEMEKTETDLAEFKKVRTEKLKHFQRKIHDYGHQMASEFSESKLKKQGLHYINQKTSPRPYILLR